MVKHAPKCLLGVVVVALFLVGSLIGTRSTTAARFSTNTDSSAAEANAAASLDPGISSAGAPLVLYAGANARLEAIAEPSPTAFANPAGNLDQVRNGSAAAPVSPADWVNGNAGASNAHYVEGYSIPYRLILTNLPLGAHNVKIEWDIKHSDKHAIDYITHFDRINNPSHLLAFGHAPEVIDPTIGVPGLGAPSTFAIPTPSSVVTAGVCNPVGQPGISFAALPAAEKVMTIFNGTISTMSYVSEGDLTASIASTRLSIDLTATDPTVVLAWGGHIGSRADWGFDGTTPCSAGGINGSPYHTRFIELDGAGGNQDRSLSAVAVFVPCGTCAISGPDPVCPGSTNVYTSTISGTCDSPAHSWTISGGGSIVGSTTGSSVSVLANSACGSYTLTDTITCSGCAGSPLVCTKTVNVVDTTPPVVTFCPPNQTLECPATPVFGTPTFTDNCDTNLTITHVDSSTAGCGSTGVFTRVTTATDDCGNSASCTQTITVVDTTPPSITCPGPVTVQCDADVPAPNTGLVTASDTCGSVTVTFVGDVPSTGKCPKTITRTYKATDACGNMATCTQIITVNDTTPPVLSGCPSDATFQCISQVPSPATVTASDNCDGSVPVSFKETQSSPGSSCNNTITRTWTAKDSCGNTATCTQIITVNDTTAPTITCPANQTIACTQTPSFGTPTASDNCDPNPTIVVVGTTTTPGPCPQTFDVTRTWKARDVCGNESAPCSQTIHVVDNVAPTITCPADQTIACTQTPSFGTPTATDNCDPSPTIVVVGTTTTPGPCPQTFDVTRTWKAKDACGNESATCSQTIHVVDSVAPVVTCPSDITVGECNNVVTFSTTATDNCDTTPTVVCSPASGSVFPVGMTTVTCTATDDCGNSSNCSFKVTVVANPTCTIPLPDPLPGCGSTGNTLKATVSGGQSPFTFVWTVGGNGTLTAGQGTDTITYSVGLSGDVIVGLTVTDSLGCETKCSRTFGCISRQEFCALTQGFYGNAGGKFNGVGTLSLIQSLLSTDLVVGKPGRSLTIKFAAAQCIIDRLPATGAPTALPSTLGDAILDPTTCQTSPTALPLDSQGNFRNVLLGQTIALSLNVRLDTDLGGLTICNTMVTQKALPGPDGLLGTADDVIDPGPDGILGTADDPILTVIIPLPVLNALTTLGLPQTVNGLLELANRALAGQPTGGATLSDINTAVNSINVGFDQCRFLISCTNPVSLLRIGDLERLVAAGFPVELAQPLTLLDRMGGRSF